MENTKNNEAQLLEQFKIEELEDRLEMSGWAYIPAYTTSCFWYEFMVC